MRTFKLLVIFLFCFSLKSISQTINPSCYSNAVHWNITKIETLNDATYVYLYYYSYVPEYSFYFNRNTYIENFNTLTSTKYYLRSAGEIELDRSYTLRPYTVYNFVLAFDKIPSDWTDINIKEPPVSNANAWYWKDISLNQPDSYRLKIDKFFKNSAADFFVSYMHPLSNYVGYTYSVDENKVRATFYYKSNYTDVEMHFNGKLVDEVRIIGDSQFFPAFVDLAALRTWIFKQKDGQEYSSEFERSLNTTIMNMTNTQLASVALTVLYNTQ